MKHSISIENRLIKNEYLSWNKEKQYFFDELAGTFEDNGNDKYTAENKAYELMLKDKK